MAIQFLKEKYRVFMNKSIMKCGIQKRGYISKISELNLEL